MATTKNTKSTTKAINDLVAEHDAEVTANADALTRLLAEQEQASEDLAALNGRLGSGDDSVTAIELVTAKTEIERLEVLVNARRAKAVQLQRSRPGSPWIAGTLAEAMNVAQFGIGFKGVTTIPVEGMTLPVGYWVQAHAIEASPITGYAEDVQIALTVYRDPIHRVLSAAEVEQALNAHPRIFGAKVDTPVTNSLNIDSYRVRLAGVYPETMTLTANIAAHNYAGPKVPGVVTQSSNGERVYTVMVDTKPHPSNGAIRIPATRLGDVRVQDGKVKAEGICNVVALAGSMPLGDVAVVAEKSLDDNVGLYFSGLGRCVDIDYQREYVEGSGELVYKVTQTFEANLAE